MVYVVTGLFILLDIVSGIVNAIKQKNLSSRIMREGLFHKCGSVLCLVFGALVDYAQNFIDIGISFPVANIFCAYIITMELASIIENICKINPEIAPEKLQQYFEKLKSGDKN